jgi:uncharacterized protein RhaS with RHS repeats
MRARYYDPNTARYLTRDPIAAATRAPYSYVSNNPLNRTDPAGLFGFSVIGAIAGAVTGAVVNTVSYALTCGSDCRTTGYVGAAVGGAVGGAIAGACIGTTLQVAGCGAVGGETAYLVQSAISGTPVTFVGAVDSAAIGAAGNGFAAEVGAEGGYFGRPFPANALSNTAGSAAVWLQGRLANDESVTSATAMNGC